MITEACRHAPPQTGQIAQSRHDWPNRVRGPRNIGDPVFRAGGVFDVGEQCYASAGLREPALEFTNYARLAHAPLAGQQHMVAFLYPVLQDAELRFSVEEVGTAHPAAGG